MTGLCEICFLFRDVTRDARLFRIERTPYPSVDWPSVGVTCLIHSAGTNAPRALTSPLYTTRILILHDLCKMKVKVTSRGIVCRERARDESASANYCQLNRSIALKSQLPATHDFDVGKYQRQFRRPRRTPCASQLFLHSTQLNRDIRWMIYDLLDFPPISLSCLGFLLSCREALVEAELVAALQLKQQLLSLKSVIPDRGHHIVLPTFPSGVAFRDLNNIKIMCHEAALNDMGKTFQVLFSHYFMKVTFDARRPRNLKCR